MYNRYIPQSDGTYRRRTEPDKCVPRPAPCQQAPTPPPPAPSCPSPKPCGHPQNSEASGFLKNLLPHDLDTGDLLIMVLLLLMSGDCAEDRGTALLTLALYLIL